MNDLHDMTSDDRARLLREYFRNSTRLSDIVGILIGLDEKAKLLPWILAVLGFKALELVVLIALLIRVTAGIG